MNRSFPPLKKRAGGIYPDFLTTRHWENPPPPHLSARFGRSSTEINRRTCIVIIEVAVEGEKHDVGIVVDAVSEVLEIPASEIEPPPSFGAKIRADFISGMGKVAGKFVILLEVDKVLSIDEMAVL